MKDPAKVKQGKKNRAAGAAFELRVRKDLEENGWIVDKWSNNIEFSREFECINPNDITAEELHKMMNDSSCCIMGHTDILHDGKTICPNHHRDMGLMGKIIPAKRKYAGPGRPMAIGTGFPDFICIKVHNLSTPQTYRVQYVECKTNGKLDKSEKEKCRWMVEIGFIVLIASKTKVKNRIVIKYEDFWEKYGEI